MVNLPGNPVNLNPEAFVDSFSSVLSAETQLEKIHFLKIVFVRVQKLMVWMSTRYFFWDVLYIIIGGAAK